MKEFCEFLKSSYTCYHAVENAETLLAQAGFSALSERESWDLAEGGKYYVTRGGGSLIAFRYSARGAFRIVASHTDSPCLKLKGNAALSDGAFTRLNTEPYGGGLWYTFFDRPLKIAGRRIAEEDGALVARPYASDFCVVLPSLAIHQNRQANTQFSPNLQTELPLLSLGKKELAEVIGGTHAYDLYAVPAVDPFFAGPEGEFLSSPRLDDLTGVFFSLKALTEADGAEDTVMAACFHAEEIGSSTQNGAASDFLRSVLARIARAQGRDEEERLAAEASSLLLSLDNAHALHPNHPEVCDPTNRPVPGGGVVIKGHAGGSYTTDGLTAAVMRKIFENAGVKYQFFYNRSDAASGSTLGAILLRQTSIPAADLGLAQLAMHSAVETVACSDLEELKRALAAFYACRIAYAGDRIEIKA